MRFQSILVVRPFALNGALPSFNEKVQTISAAERVAEALLPGPLSCFRLGNPAAFPFMARFEFELQASGRLVAPYPGWTPTATTPGKEGWDRQEAIWQILEDYPYRSEDQEEPAHALLYATTEDPGFLRSASLWLRRPLPETHGIAVGRALLLDLANATISHI